jgi:ABC-type branched-subunit amino acid transport system substrate-binding protein
MLLAAAGCAACIALAACGGTSNSTTSAAAAGSATTSAAGNSTTSPTANPTSASGAATKAPVTLAVVTYKVPGLDLLTPMTAGAQAAASQINAAGGIGGRKVVITSCNSLFQPATDTVCAHNALNANATAMIGCDGAWSSSGLQVLEAAKVPSINCLTGTVDVTNPWSFGITPSGLGEDQALAGYICERSDVKTMAFIAANLTADLPLVAGVKKVLTGCGKTLAPFLYPATATDVAPYVQKAANAKPDFVLLNVFGTQVVSMVTAFKQNGIPASKIAAPDADLPYATISQAGSVLNGIYSIEQFTPWDNTSDPQVAAYFDAMKGSSVDPRDGNVEWGYSDVMTIYDAAKHIGVDNFSSATLANFLQTQNNFPIPLSRVLVNPGPKIAPQEKQPWARIYQLQGGKFVLVPAGPSKDGWVEGWV